MSIRVLLADNHAAILKGVGRLIRDQEDMEVVGQTADGRAVIDLCRRAEPDVVLMDVGIPVFNGIQATEQIHQEQPRVKIIAFSTHASRRSMADAFNAGASTYLLKDCDSHELLAAIRAVGPGETLPSGELKGDPPEPDLPRKYGATERRFDSHGSVACPGCP